MSFLNRPQVRALARRLGIARSASKLIRLLSRDTMSYNPKYELRFATELFGSVSPGDCVWDVGANIGFFTRQLAERVGTSGCVVAFEPFKSTFDRLQSEMKGFPQVRCLQLALGADERDLFVKGIPESSFNTLMNEVTPGGGEAPSAGEKVHVTTGTKLIRDGQPAPNVIKIDVEGFEEDVLWGFRESLGNSCCSTILMEIHYSLAEERGFLRAPDRMQSLLRDAGFRTRWLDPGHLKASRPPRGGGRRTCEPQRC